MASNAESCVPLSCLHMRKPKLWNAIMIAFILAAALTRGLQADATGEEKPRERHWSTSELMDQCRSQIDDIYICNQLIQKYLKIQQAKWSAMESSTDQILWDHPEFPAPQRDETTVKGGGKPDSPPERVKGLNEGPDRVAPAQAEQESAMTVLMGDGIVVDESGTYWYSYRSQTESFQEAKITVKGRKVSARGVWSDPRVALDLSAMKTVKIESQPAMIRNVDRGIWIMWLVVSHRADRQVCSNTTEGNVLQEQEDSPGERIRAFVIAESEAPEGPFRLRSQLSFDEQLSSLRCCRDLIPIVDGEFAYLVSSSQADEPDEKETDDAGKPLVILLDDDLVGIKSAWLLPGTSGNPISLARHGDLWYLLTTTSRPRREALRLVDLIRHNDLWTSPAMGSEQAWNHSGQPMNRKLNPENSTLSLSINVLVNPLVGCVHFLFANGYTYLSCGTAEDLLPGARLM